LTLSLDNNAILQGVPTSFEDEFRVEKISELYERRKNSLKLKIFLQFGDFFLSFSKSFFHLKLAHLNLLGRTALKHIFFSSSDRLV